MGLLDSILGQQQPAAPTQKSGINMAAVLGAIELIRRSGGLNGLVAKLSSGGLGDAVGSWIGTGRNQPVSPGALEGALGGGMLSDLAAKFGLAPEEMSSQLSEVLPQVVDRATPTGEITSGGEVPDDLAHQLSSLLRG